MAPHLDMSSSSGSLRAEVANLLFNRQLSSSQRQSIDVATDDSDSLRSESRASCDSIYTGLRRPLHPGVYVPTMCFFDDRTEDLDLRTIATHAVRLAKSGVTGIATQGSNGEAVHLSHDERRQVTATTRKALSDAGFSRMPIIVGCGAQSTRETIALCQEAWESGGDYALVLPPSYYAALFAPKSETVIQYFTAIADASPIPIIIYNYPGAVNGMDLSSDIIIRLSQHPNIVGVKLTCGNTGKLNRVAAATRSTSWKQGSATTGTTLEDAEPEFLVLAGSADFSIQALVAGGHGILAGLANIAPRACIKTIELFQAQKYEEAQAMQEVVSRGDWTAIQGGVVGVKAGLQSWSGYGGYGRSPLPRPSAEEEKVWKDGFRELVLLEKSL